MKKLLIMLCCGMLAGCEYVVPLVTIPEIEIDGSVIGLWQRSTEDGKTEQLLALPLGPNEYLVSYPAGRKDAMFARACLCRVGDRTLVQLHWIGTAAGKLPDDKRVFQFATYSVEGPTLTVRLLNSEVVKRDLASPEALAAAIAANAANPNLYKEGMVFTRIEK